jgi:cytoskeletal protein CcmA (bactofilin family)
MAFGSSKSSRTSVAKSNGSAPGGGQVNLIAEGTTIVGTFRADGDVRVSGRVEGTVQVSGKIFVTQEGSIEGDIAARNADVAGRVDGTLQVEERLLLHGTARVQADIEVDRLVMEEGAKFNGAAVMDGTPSKPRPITAPTPDDSTAKAPAPSGEA